MGPRTDPHPFAAADTPSFLDLLDRVTADVQLDARRKANLRSAIKSLAQWLGADLAAMPAHPRYLSETGMTTTSSFMSTVLAEGSTFRSITVSSRLMTVSLCVLLARS
jgi:hypothetical protein